MAAEDPWQFWLNVMGNSDDDDEEAFEGFTLRELVKGEESDVDLDLVVQQDASQRFNDDDDDESESGGEEDADLPVAAGPSQAKRQKRMSKTKRNELTTCWSAQTKEIVPNLKFDELREEGKLEVGVSHNLPADATPFDFFSLLLPESFWSDVAEQTNLYAQQKQEEKGAADKNWKPAAPDEMKLFIFVQFMFGIHRMPETAMYWSTDPLLRVPAIADIMSKGRFQKLSQYFHLNDNRAAVPKGQPGYDPLFKVRPLLNVVLENSRAHYSPGQDISIDEAMIKFNGRLSFKQYIKGVYLLLFLAHEVMY